MPTSLLPPRPRWLPSMDRLAGDSRERVRRRRRLELGLLAVAVLLVGAAGLIGAAAASSERVTAMWVGAEVSADGSAQITELIDWDYGVHHRHGIFRDVPGLAGDGPVTVFSATAPAEFEAYPNGSETQIRIGDPDRTISGRHRYRIGYPLTDVATEQLAWNAVGTEWAVTVSRVEIHVVAPFEVTAPTCVQGVMFSQTPCQITEPGPGHLVARIDRLNPGQGVTLSGGRGRQLDGPPKFAVPAADLPTRGGGGLLIPGLLAAAAALVGAALMAAVIRRAGRERVAAGAVAAGRAEPGQQIRVDLRRLASAATVQDCPPEELTPEQGGVLLAEAVREEHKAAWLAGAAAAGYLDIVGRQSALTLVRRSRSEQAEARDPWTAAEIGRLFQSRKRVSLSGYDPQFAETWRSIGDRLQNWRSSCGLWDKAGDRRRLAAWVIGGLATLAGLLVLIVGAVKSASPGAAWPYLVGSGAAVAGAGLAGLILGWELRVLTPAGADLWLRTESFRRYLADADSQHAEQAASRGLLPQYTAWAVAFGQADRWSRAVARSAVPPSHTGAYLPRSALYLPAAAYTASRAPSSSSGGGGGFSGGSSGGGGGVGSGSGGGGGGSW